MPASVHKAALVLDLLGELTSVGLTERLPCGRYQLGWRTVALARTKLATNGHREQVTPIARRLASHFGETVHVAAWDRGRVLYAASQRPPGGVVAPAEPVAAHLTPPGMVLLAERAGGIGTGFEPGELERMRRRGYAVGPQRALDRVDCAAVPVRMSAGRWCQRHQPR
jgi:DNA-binding IclR family transcriptional regulator